MTDSTTQRKNPIAAGATSPNGLVILNPAAGEGNPEKVRQALQACLGADSYDLHETNPDEDLRNVVQTAVQQNNYRWVAAVGGDGTVSQVADGLIDDDIPLAIIPAGTGNVIAHTLGIPQDLKAACQLISSDAPAIRRIDGIKVGQQHFFLQLGIGLESVTMEKTSSAQKNRWGMAAYVWTLVKEAFGWQPHHFDLTIDGHTYPIQASELVIANSGRIGLWDLAWDQAISPSDGQVDVAVIRARSLTDYIGVLAALLSGQQQKSTHIQFFSAHNEVALDAKKPLPLHGDGEILNNGLPLTAVVVPGALQVIVPQQNSET